MKKILVLLLIMFLTSCAAQQTQVQLNPTQGNSVSGVITLTTEPQGTRFTGTISGLSPGKHGFHIHEFGDCSAPDAKSAGGHFDPQETPHGPLNHEHSHVGDLGNIIANNKGIAKVNILAKKVSLTGPFSVRGRGMIVHEKEDDYSQPTGNAGARVACGVIR